MRQVRMVLALATLSLEASAGAQTAADPALAMYPGADSLKTDEPQFDAAQLIVRPVRASSATASTATVEGRVTRRQAIAPRGRSGLEVFRNYESALKAGGWTTIFRCELTACGTNMGQIALKRVASYRYGGQWGPLRYIAARGRDGTQAGILVIGPLVNALPQTNGRAEISMTIIEPAEMEQRLGQ